MESKLFQKQPMMRKVLYSLMPLFAFSLYLHGLRALAVSGVVFGAGILTEFLFERTRGKKTSEAVLVTCSLYALSMPPSVPLWIAGVGIVFAVFFAKEVYGGFGRNVFNPAIAGRLFAYISFATIMQSSFPAFGSFGFPIDAATGATPLSLMRNGESQSLLALVFGLHRGSIGETSSALIAAAGIYLVATKTASWRIILSTLLSALALNGSFLALGLERALPMESLLAGSFLFVAVFMATDPVSGPKKPLSQFVYGGIIGASAVAIRTFSAFPEGTSFAVLLGNSFACFIDELAAGKKASARPGLTSTAPEGGKGAPAEGPQTGGEAAK